MRTGTSLTQSFRYWQTQPSKSKIGFPSMEADDIYSDNYQSIMSHLRAKLDVPAFEWRRVLKVGDVLIKEEQGFGSVSLTLLSSYSRSRRWSIF